MAAMSRALRPLALVLACGAVGALAINRHAIAAGVSFVGDNVGDRLAKGDRVTKARARLKDTLPALFAAHDLHWPPQQVFLRAFKSGEGPDDAGAVELWASDKKSGPLTLIKSYPACAKSGGLGPKRRQGDLQVPEGFYTISKLNPQSTYHLALRVDYPNASDTIRGHDPAQGGERGVDLGGDIMVHGSCVTIGCIPLTDDVIEEVYLVVDAVFGKRPVPIHIFPRRLDAAGLQALSTSTPTSAATHRAFWAELAAGYAAFEASHVVPAVTVAKDGRYVVAASP
jgi:murein L,D-transpeptidase YafK